MIVHTGRGHHRLVSDINITPFVDVMLVLLIIFMVTAPLLQQGLPVNLPQAQSQALKRAKNDIVVTVQKGGQIYIGDEATVIPMDRLEEQLTGIFATRQQKDLFIKADTDLLYGVVVKIMSIAKKAGVDRIGMITQPETEGT